MTVSTETRIVVCSLWTRRGDAIRPSSLDEAGAPKKDHQDPVAEEEHVLLAGGVEERLQLHEIRRDMEALEGVEAKRDQKSREEEH